jgi:hypothetical protein
VEGSTWIDVGTLELDDTFRAYIISGTTSPLEAVSVTCEDGVGVAEVVLNYNASDVATNGTIKARANDPTVRTYRYVARFRCM